MTITIKPFEYKDGKTTCIGQVAWDESYASPKPGILVNHAWGGLDGFAQDKAIQMAAIGMGLIFNPLGRLCHTSAPRYAPASEVAQW